MNTSNAPKPYTFTKAGVEHSVTFEVIAAGYFAGRVQVFVDGELRGQVWKAERPSEKSWPWRNLHVGGRTQALSRRTRQSAIDSLTQQYWS